MEGTCHAQTSLIDYKRLIVSFLSIIVELQNKAINY